MTNVGEGRGNCCHRWGGWTQINAECKVQNAELGKFLCGGFGAGEEGMGEEGEAGEGDEHGEEDHGMEGDS